MHRTTAEIQEAIAQLTFELMQIQKEKPDTYRGVAIIGLGQAIEALDKVEDRIEELDSTP